MDLLSSDNDSLGSKDWILSMQIVCIASFLYKQPWYEARLHENCMEVACDLVVALDCILKGPKFQSHLRLTIFFWRHAADPASISAIGISLLSQVSSHMNVSQGSETSKSQSYLLFLCITSCRSVLTIIVVNLSLKWGLMPGHNHMITVYNGTGGRASYAMTRRRTCNNLGTNFNYMVTWEWDWSL